jgi:hypothetical protein
MSSKSSYGQLLERGRISVDDQLNAVVEADPSKGFRHALIARTTVTCPPFADWLL